MSSRRAEAKTYLDIYNLTIAPKLREIDLFMKEREEPVTVWQTAQLLDMPYSETEKILHMLGIETINHTNFFSVLLSGTSEICGVIRRETERGFPDYYTAKDISFIYEIDEEKIDAAFETIGVKKIKGEFLPFVFEMLVIQNT